MPPSGLFICVKREAVGNRRRPTETMHKSRLAGFIIDCHTDDLGAAADFWTKALGVPPKTRSSVADGNYVTLDMPSDEPHIEVQKVSHPSRVHLDIESDDVQAEVKRLEALGAKKIASVQDWCVMEAPTGQRFCVVPAESALFQTRAREWP
jgi:predicted enzyme related to lactoylglutathione lyase